MNLIEKIEEYLEESKNEKEIEDKTEFLKYINSIFNTNVTLENSPYAPDVFEFSIPRKNFTGDMYIQLIKKLTAEKYVVSSDAHKLLKDAEYEKKLPLSMGYQELTFKKTVKKGSKTDYIINLYLSAPGNKVKGVWNINIF